MKVQMMGDTDAVYTTPIGMEIHDFDHDEGEYAEGWMQISPTERQHVVRKRTGHMSVMWFEVKEKQ